MKLRVLTWEIYRVIYKQYYTTPGVNGKVRLLPIQKVFYKG